MDFQHREGGKTGTGGILSASESNAARRERLRKLALETIDLSKDPYFMKNHLGSYECKLCLTLHNNEGSYLTHTQGKKHQANLGRRAAREAAMNPLGLGTLAAVTPKPATLLPTMMLPKVRRIGRPGYKIVRICDPETHNLGLFFMIHYPEIGPDVIPRHRFMSSFEQRIEPPNRNYQYLVFAADPYERIAFKLSSREILMGKSKEEDADDDAHSHFFSHWDPHTRLYSLQVVFKNNK